MIKQYLIKQAGSEKAALDLACQVIAALVEGTSMGMLRTGKKAKNVQSEYGGRSEA